MKANQETDATEPFDVTTVRDRLRELGELDADHTLDVRLLAGGRSNLTYVLSSSAGREWILRRPPIGSRLETAHDMGREVTIQRALSDSAVPVPRIVFYDADADHAGGSYYIMDRVVGDVLRTDAEFSALEQRHRDPLSYEYIDALAALHTVDYTSLELENFGRPSGYLERQVRRWTKQFAASKSRELPLVEQLGSALAERIPHTCAHAIVHGDFRFDNMIIGVDPSPRIAAVLDWEMSTLGDPLTDLGLVHLFWSGWEGIDNPIAGTPSSHSGYPSFEDIAERYAVSTGFDLDGLGWYSSFAFFKMAIILEGIHLRFTNNETVGEGFENIGTMVAPLAERGLAALSGS
ncbi:phosphotransferase family protein [Rhodococcus sp. 077-4]|uniref:phosphotransferase family protein n=1 Tax=Rhodococcus sp. 077-4 TaxID=2789271 RepID=UPI0039F4F909